VTCYETLMAVRIVLPAVMAIMVTQGLGCKGRPVPEEAVQVPARPATPMHALIVASSVDAREAQVALDRVLGEKVSWASGARLVKGYPKLVNGSAVAGLQAGRMYVLLGFCSSTDAAQEQRFFRLPFVGLSRELLTLPEGFLACPELACSDYEDRADCLPPEFVGGKPRDTLMMAGLKETRRRIFLDWRERRRRELGGEVDWLAPLEISDDGKAMVLVREATAQSCLEVSYSVMASKEPAGEMLVTTHRGTPICCNDRPCQPRLMSDVAVRAVRVLTSGSPARVRRFAAPGAPVTIELHTNGALRKSYRFSADGRNPELPSDALGILNPDALECPSDLAVGADGECRTKFGELAVRLSRDTTGVFVTGIIINEVQGDCAFGPCPY
jgi:hypothetical protein